jgi:hypothetical protein
MTCIYPRCRTHFERENCLPSMYPSVSLWTGAFTQVLTDYLDVSLDTICLFLLHEPDSPLNRGTRIGRPKKSSPVMVVAKYFNIKVLEIEMVPDMSAEQYTIALGKVIKSPEYGCLLLYTAWITNKEL